MSDKIQEFKDKARLLGFGKKFNKKLKDLQHINEILALNLSEEDIYELTFQQTICTK